MNNQNLSPRASPGQYQGQGQGQGDQGGHVGQVGQVKNIGPKVLSFGVTFLHSRLPRL